MKRPEEFKEFEQFEPKALGSIWIICPCSEEVVPVLKKMLSEVGARVHLEQEPPSGKASFSIILCPSGEDVGSEVRRVRRLQALAPDAPILVLGLRVSLQLARSALLAGARGFLHPGMKPAEIVYALSEASKDERLVPRELLEAFLVEAQSRADLAMLSPRQQEILMLIAEAATSKGEIVLSRELLEDFLMEVAIM
jgi:DNA-binding NarL/FixJ family response regulator